MQLSDFVRLGGRKIQILEPRVEGRTTRLFCGCVWHFYHVAARCRKADLQRYCRANLGQKFWFLLLCLGKQQNQLGAPQFCASGREQISSFGLCYCRGLFVGQLGADLCTRRKVFGSPSLPTAAYVRSGPCDSRFCVAVIPNGRYSSVHQIWFVIDLSA